MFVRNRMSTRIISIGPDQSVPDAQGLLTLHDIKHLPVVEGDKLVGVLSRVDVAKASPSTASTFDVGELNYLLSKIKVRDIMAKKPIVATPHMMLEEAATLMRSKHVSFLPVVEGDRLVGVITESNIFDAFIEILGFTDKGTRLTVEVEDSGPGILSEIATVFASCGVNIGSCALYHLPGNRAAMVFGTALPDTTELEEALRQAGYPVYWKLKIT
ncbi:MAG: CBS domain-containing protein [Clostridia bacterium]|nr:CBS domain-containing protein [Clostridia bacterium]